MIRAGFLFSIVVLTCSLPVSAEELRLQIVDPSGAVVPGAKVVIWGAKQNAPVASAITDGRGRITSSVLFPAIVQVQAAGFERLNRRIDEVVAAEVILRLVPAILHTSIEVTLREDPDSAGTVEGSSLAIDRSGARTVYDAVDKLIPGAYVPSRGVLGHGLGISNSITLRGLGGSPTTRLLIVIDGRPEVMGLMGHPIPDFYSLTNVGSIRVTEGPASVLYGNRAMGGAIEIEPSPLEPGFHTELTAGLGSYYTGQYRLSHGGGIGRFHYGISSGVEHTGGDRENSSFHNQDGTIHLSYDLTPAWKASLQGRYGHFSIEDPGTVESPAAGHWSRVGRGGFTASLENRGEQAWGAVRVFSSHGHHMIYDGFRSVDSNTGGRVQETVALRPGIEIDLGFDASRYGGRAGSIATGYTYGEHHITEEGGFTRARWSLNSMLRLNAGFRYDHNSTFGGVAATEFGASWRLPGGYALSTAIASGFRNPTIRELYLFPAPTPNLQPERIWNYQATFQLSPVPHLLAWVTGYYSDVRNLIVATGRYPDLKLENIGRAANRGLEVNARLRLSRSVGFSSGYAFLRSTGLAPYVPQSRFIFALDLDLNRAFVSIGGSVVGRTWTDTSRTRQLDGYTATSFKCTVPWGDRWSFYATVDNFLDREYQELAGYPMPGANASGGVRFRF